MRPRRHRVTGVQRQTADTVTLTLEPLEGEGGGFAPGQFNMLYAPGVGEIPISFSGGRSEGVDHTVRAVGAVSRALCEARPGDVLGARGPYGAGWRVEDAEGGDVVIAGGGIGLAPLRPVVEQVLAHRERYGRVAVLVGARSPDLLLFRDDLERWAARPDLDVAVTVDAAPGGWNGSVGLVTDLVPRLHTDPAAAVAMVCGPEVMMRFTATALADLGLPPGRIRISLERNMRCGIGQCGHCQLGPTLICRDGPVYGYDEMRRWLGIREV
jgi:NAD(P)H-flavin reductase